MGSFRDHRLHRWKVILPAELEAARKEKSAFDWRCPQEMLDINWRLVTANSFLAKNALRLAEKKSCSVLSVLVESHDVTGRSRPPKKDLGDQAQTSHYDRIRTIYYWMRVILVAVPALAQRDLGTGIFKFHLSQHELSPNQYLLARPSNHNQIGSTSAIRQCDICWPTRAGTRVVLENGLNSGPDATLTAGTGALTGRQGAIEGEAVKGRDRRQPTTSKDKMHPESCC